MGVMVAHLYGRSFDTTDAKTTTLVAGPGRS
jgi:hypothetical protein